jgi:hypothetical protein
MTPVMPFSAQTALLVMVALAALRRTVTFWPPPSP